MQIISNYNIQPKVSYNEMNHPSFGRKLNLFLYGEAGQVLKNLSENTVLGQKASENTVYGLALLALSALGANELQGKGIDDIRAYVSEQLENLRKNVKKDSCRKKRETNIETRKSLLKEMASCGMTQEQISAKLNISPSLVSKEMKKYGIQTDFSKKYNTGLAKISNGSIKLNEAISEKGYRKRMLQNLKQYPDLCEKYKRMLLDSKKYSKDQYKQFLLQVFEAIMYDLSKRDEIKYHSAYFDVLNTKYINDLENICKNYYSNMQADGSSWKMLVLLKGEKISSEELEEWTHYPEFNCDEFMTLREYKPEQKQKLAELKRNGEFLNIDIWKVLFHEEQNNERNVYKVNFDEEKSLTDYLKTICKIHEIAYGEPIILGKEKTYEKFNWLHIKDEFFGILKHDTQLDAIYNLLKYMDAEEMKKYSYSSEEVRDLDPNGLEYKTLLHDVRRAVHNIDFDDPNNIKINQLADIMNRKDLFEDIMVTPHSILRFISRIVLKNNYNPNLENVMPEKLNLFREELKGELTNSPIIWTYTEKFRTGTAPQIQIKESSIGDFITITLDKTGHIHTIYEDRYSIIRAKQKAMNSEFRKKLLEK